MALTKISTAMISQSAAVVDLNVDAGTFYVDTTNNRVGVGGKTDPDTPLHVIGTVTATLFAGSGASLTNIPNSALTNSSITINSTATSLGGSITLGTDDVAEGSSNLYYTNARADARIAAATTDDLSEGSSNLYYTDARVDARVSGGSLGNITTTGYIRGPSSFTIDPAAHGDNSGTVVIAGNLQVDGTTTTINSTTMTVDDKNITLASGSANAAAANGAGFTVDIGSGTNPAITYDGTNDEWDFNKPLNVTGAITSTGTISTSGELDGATLDISGNAAIAGYLNFDGGSQNGLIRFNNNNAIGYSNNFLYINPSNHFTSGVYINSALKVDSGLIGSYNEDLQLRTANTTALTLSNTDQSATFVGTISSGAITTSGNFLMTGGYSVYLGTTSRFSSDNNGGFGINYGTTGGTAATSLAIYNNTTATIQLNRNGTISSGAITSSAAVNADTINATSSITTGYGLSLTNGSTNYLLYSNTGNDTLYMRDTTNSSMITAWNPNSFVVYKAATFNSTISSGAITSSGDASITGGSSGSTVLTLTTNALVDTPLMVFQRTGGAVAGKLAYEDGNTAIAFGTTTAHELKFLTNNTSRLEIDSSGNAVFSGNLSSGAITTSGHVSLPDNKYVRLGTGNDFIIYHDGATNYIQTIKQDSDLIIRGNDGGTNFNALTIDMSAGGNATFAGTISSGAITSSGAISGTNGAFSGSLALSADSSQLQLGTGNRAQIFHNSAALYLRTSTGSVIVQASALNHYSADASTLYFSAASGGLSFGGTQFLTSSRNLTNIGTISSGAITSSGQLLVDTDTEHQIKIDASSASGASMHLNTAGAYAYTVYQNSNRIWRIGAYGGSSFTIRDHTGSTNPLVINSSGNVGIGTDSAEGRLHVEVLGSNATPPIKINRGLDGGRIQLQYSSNESGYGEIGQMYAGTGRTQIWIGANLNSFSTGHDSSPVQHDTSYASWFSDWDSYRDRFTISRIASGTTSRIMVINSSGSVGIGTDSPIDKFQVDGRIRISAPDNGGAPAMTSTLRMYGYEGRGAGIEIRDNVNNASGGDNREWFVGTGYNQTNFNIGYSATGTQTSYTAQNKLTITTDGKIGIGTHSPQNLLHIGGGSSDSRVQFTNNSSGNAYADGFWVGMDSAQAYLLQRENQPLIIYTNAIRRFEVQGNGTIGIGNSSDAYGLMEHSYTGYNSGSPEYVIKPNTTPGSGILSTTTHFKNSNGGSTSSNNRHYVKIDGHLHTQGEVVSDRTFGIVNGQQTNSHGILLYPYCTYSTRYSSWNNVMGTNAAAAIGSTDSGFEQASSYGGAGAAAFETHFGSFKWHVWPSSATTGFGASLSASSYEIASLDNAGNMSIDGSLTQNASDERLKENITVITGAIDKVKALRGVEFDWKTTTPQPMRGHDIGLIAQEVQAVCVEAVKPAPFDQQEVLQEQNPDENDGVGLVAKGVYESKSGEDYLTVDTNKIVPILIEAIKELEARITELEG